MWSRDAHWCTVDGSEGRGRAVSCLWLVGYAGKAEKEQTSSKLARGDVNGLVTSSRGWRGCGRKPTFLYSSTIWNVSFKVLVWEGSIGAEGYGIGSPVALDVCRCENGGWWACPVYGGLDMLCA